MTKTRYLIVIACKVFVGVYAGVGVLGAYVMALAIPALNFWGMTVYALTWPAFVFCANTPIDCNPLSSMPMWFLAKLFTF